jgi:hypothetical protein
MQVDGAVWEMYNLYNIEGIIFSGVTQFRGVGVVN